jgi:YD repeat-containing protein
MKTATIILSLLFIGSNSLMAQKAKKVRDPNYESLKGKVKTYTTTTYASSQVNHGGPPAISEDSMKARLRKDMNDMGELSSEQVLAGGEQRYWTRRTYDQWGKLLVIRGYDTLNRPLWINKYTYDKKGRPLQMKTWKGDSTYYGRTDYKFDRKGNLIQEDEYIGETPSHKVKYEYYNKNLRDKTVYYWDTDDKYWKIEDKLTYGYDKQGNVTSLNDYHGNSYTYTYEYDNKGNWIRKTVKHQGQPSQIIVRQIEYR